MAIIRENMTNEAMAVSKTRMTTTGKAVAATIELNETYLVINRTTMNTAIEASAACG
jgi:hypothetical protein